MSSPLLCRTVADAVVVFHFSYVAFVILGQFAILAGLVMGWRWIRNPVFRAVHLLAIGVVVLEAWFGVTCPLTTWEQQLREKAGDVSYRGDFIARWVHEALFYDAPPMVFTVGYSVFGLLVLLTFLFAPPKRKPIVPRETAKSDDTLRKQIPS